VKDEDIDWFIYHLLTPREPEVVDDLISQSGLDPATIRESLLRLEKKLLIEVVEDKVRVLSFGESLIRCQLKYDLNLSYTIENGVIKAKKKE
jgi:hypothetical protein